MRVWHRRSVEDVADADTIWLGGSLVLRGSTVSGSDFGEETVGSATCGSCFCCPAAVSGSGVAVRLTRGARFAISALTTCAESGAEKLAFRRPALSSSVTAAAEAPGQGSCRITSSCLDFRNSENAPPSRLAMNCTETMWVTLKAFSSREDTSNTPRTRLLSTMGTSISDLMPRCRIEGSTRGSVAARLLRNAWCDLMQAQRNPESESRRAPIAGTVAPTLARQMNSDPSSAAERK